ncbi:uncharacterized protein LOC115953824 isoform X2 [Quercus lobata]|uniref:uncharacterized protein LOC115953824 isoform X2 n=1 Tax=Quercus lobata TaxID=97700 RepID=UPI0012471D64|nr:uncharacterized protein LOC115953824 isoform X2 [Quercus lobata]
MSWSWLTRLSIYMRSLIVNLLLITSNSFFHVEMLEFLIFNDGKDFTESREEAVGVLQKAERREDAICTAETGKSDPQNPFLKIKTQSTTKKVGNQNMLGTFNL